MINYFKYFQSKAKPSLFLFLPKQIVANIRIFKYIFEYSSQIFLFAGKYFTNIIHVRICKRFGFQNILIFIVEYKLYKQGTLQEMHPYMMNKYVQQTAKQKKGT